MDCTIEILAPEKWQVLKDLWLEALQKEAWAYGPAYEEEVVLSDEEWKKKFDAGTKYVARIGEQYVGLIGVTFEKKLNQQHVADIVGFYVKPEYRGKGIGRKIMERVLADLHTHPRISRIRIGVNVLLENAVKLYHDLGFKDIGLAEKAMKVNGVYYDHMQMQLLFEDKL